MATPPETTPAGPPASPDAADRPRLVVPHRFRGPTRSGNGGWTSGALAEHLQGTGATGGTGGKTVEVTLRRPPPLDVPLEVRLDPDAVELALDDAVVAHGRVVGDDLRPVDPVPPEAAASAMAGYAGLRSHPFPECFACGPGRAPGDGLRIFPGPVPGRDRVVASAWVPHGSLAESGDVLDAGLERVGVATTWAALDCAGGWSEDLEGRPSVLGRMTARVDALPVVGEPHVVVGERRRVEGRKTFTASTLYDSDHRVVATAEHVWVVVDPAAFG